MQRTGDVAARLDADRFVGREAELAIFDAAPDDLAERRILYVHGPAGIGKSALLREFARRAVARSRPVCVLDGREIGDDSARTDRAIAEAAVEDRVVLIIDEFDAWGPLRRSVRSSVVASCAGRRPTPTMSTSFAVRPASSR